MYLRNIRHSMDYPQIFCLNCWYDEITCSIQNVSNELCRCSSSAGHVRKGILNFLMLFSFCKFVMKGLHSNFLLLLLFSVKIVILIFGRVATSQHRTVSHAFKPIPCSPLNSRSVLLWTRTPRILLLLHRPCSRLHMSPRTLCTSTWLEHYFTIGHVCVVSKILGGPALGAYYIWRWKTAVVFPEVVLGVAIPLLSIVLIRHC